MEKFLNHFWGKEVDFKKEAIAGVTTFLAMAYIIAVNPSILSVTGMDAGALVTATCLTAGIITIFMGLYEIKDFPPAYTNTFYFFDCDFKKCVSDLVEEYVCFSKTVAYDTANRMIYAGAKENKIKVYDVEDDFDLIFEDLDKLKTDNIYIITGMKPYKKIKEFFKKGDNNE